MKFKNYDTSLFSAKEFNEPILLRVMYGDSYDNTKYYTTTVSGGKDFGVGGYDRHFVYISEVEEAFNTNAKEG